MTAALPDPFPAGFPPFAARAPWWGADLQTLRNTLLHRLAARRLPGGERLWFPANDGTGDALAAMLHRPPERTGRPLVVLVHGLTGSEDSAYMVASAGALLTAGHPVLRLNLRGAGPTRGLCRQQYHAGRTGDLRLVLDALPAELTAGGVALVGYSLGANTVLKLLGEEGAAAEGIVAAVAVSAPIDLRATSLRMMQPRNLLYHRHILAGMKREIAAPGIPLTAAERAAAQGAASCWEFDDRVVAPRNGWSGAEEYYAVNSAAGFLPRIRVPTLVIHALDDPWIPAASYRAVDWAANPSLVPLLPRGGGHVGFHGRERGRAWHDACAVRFLAERAR